MKKFFVLLFVVLFSGIIISCNPPKEVSAVEAAIKDAETLSYAELVEKAKAEIGDNIFTNYSNSSQVATALKAFEAATGIKSKNENTNDIAIYTKFGGATGSIKNNAHEADMLLLQDGSNLNTQLLAPGLVYNYIPKEYASVLAADDKLPSTATVYFNKLFMYNNKNLAAGDYLYNVWQLAGTAADPGHIANSGVKLPSTEAVNQNFLIMLTTPAWQAKLAAAYTSYYGHAYVPEAGVANVSEKWIKEYLANSYFFNGDTDAVKNLPKGDNGGNVVLANFNKLKGVAADELQYCSTPSLTQHIEGFDGFVYKMYSVVPKDARYPYTAAAFINFLISPEGYGSAWNKLVGYYSANPTIAPAEGDKNLAWWRENCVIEDPEYLYDLIKAGSDFVDKLSTWEKKSN